MTQDSAEALVKHARYENGWYYCWLVEKRGSEQPEWLDRLNRWTKDANKAVWFARKQDANIASCLVLDIIDSKTYQIEVCEHGFDLGSSAHRSAQVAPKGEQKCAKCWLTPSERDAQHIVCSECGMKPLAPSQPIEGEAGEDAIYDLIHAVEYSTRNPDNEYARAEMADARRALSAILRRHVDDEVRALLASNTVLRGFANMAKNSGAALHVLQAEAKQALREADAIELDAKP